MGRKIGAFFPFFLSFLLLLAHLWVFGLAYLSEGLSYIVLAVLAGAGFLYTPCLFRYRIVM